MRGPDDPVALTLGQHPAAATGAPPVEGEDVEIPLLPFVLGAVGLTFALALLGWWVASRVERRRRTARRIAETNRRWQEQGGARRPGGPDRSA